MVSPAIVLNPTSGAYSLSIGVSGTNFTGGGAATVTGFTIGGVTPPTSPITTVIANDGSWNGFFEVPMAVLKPGLYTVSATDSGALNATTTFTILPITQITQTYIGKITPGIDGAAVYSAETGQANYGFVLDGVDEFVRYAAGFLRGTTTTGTIATTLYDTNLTFPIDYLNGSILTYTSGPAVGLSQTITDTDAHSLVTGAFGVAPSDSGDTFIITGTFTTPVNIPPYQITTRIGTVVLDENNQPLWTVWT